MDKTTVQFGKFKGLPWSELIKNRGYCLWLLNQFWFTGEQRLFVQEKVRCEVCRGNQIDYPECPGCKRNSLVQKGSRFKKFF